MEEKIARMRKSSVKKVLGVLDLLAIGYGDLGSSIYYALGITALYALGATPVALLIAGIVFACTAFTYAELSSIFSSHGGSALYSRKVMNDLISFIAGWGLLLDFMVTIAISAFSIAPYLSFFLHTLRDVPAQMIFTGAIIAILFVINMHGIKQSTRISLVLTALTLLTQIVIIVLGSYFFVRWPTALEHLKIGGVSAWSPSPHNFLHGLAMAMVAFTGIESMVQLAPEARTAKKTVPRSILIAMSILLFIYLGLSIVALNAMTPQVLVSQYENNPISGIVAAFPWGSVTLGAWVGALGALILFVAANAGLIGASRLSFHMGEYFQLPRFFRTLHKTYRTPVVSLFFFALMAFGIVLLSRGNLAFLADLYNFGAMLAFTIAHASLLIHRIREPKAKRPFRAPFNLSFGPYSIPLTAVIGLLATSTVWLLIVFTKPVGRLLGLIWILIGLTMYFLLRRRYKLSPTGQVKVEEVRQQVIKPLKFKKILIPTRAYLQSDTIMSGLSIAKHHKAQVIVLHILDIPFSMPLDTQLRNREAKAENILKKIQAIGVEQGLKIEPEIIKSRFVTKSILQYAKREEVDLIVLGSQKTQQIGAVVEEILQKAPCRVWVCNAVK